MVNEVKTKKRDSREEWIQHSHATLPHDKRSVRMRTAEYSNVIFETRLTPRIENLAKVKVLINVIDIYMN